MIKSSNVDSTDTDVDSLVKSTKVTFSFTIPLGMSERKTCFMPTQLEVLKCDSRSTIYTIHTIQTQTEFRPVQHSYCHLNKECNLNQSKDNSFVGRMAKNNS